MRRARLGLCIGDREYGDRFTSCLMNHYRDQLELHMFSQKEALQENWKTLDAIVPVSYTHLTLPTKRIV